MNNLWNVIFLLLGFCIVIFNKIPPFNFVWKYFKVFLLIFFGTLLWGSIKGGIKNDIKDLLK